MTEEMLKLRGFPGGDADLRRTYERLIGQPAYIIEDPGWVRALMFNEVQAKLRGLSAGMRAAKLEGLPPVGNWHAGTTK